MRPVSRSAHSAPRDPQRTLPPSPTRKQHVGGRRRVQHPQRLAHLLLPLLAEKLLRRHGALQVRRGDGDGDAADRRHQGQQAAAWCRVCVVCGGGVRARGWIGQGVQRVCSLNRLSQTAAMQCNALSLPNHPTAPLTHSLQSCRTPGAGTSAGRRRPPPCWPAAA
jgi:hypothetical protein